MQKLNNNCRIKLTSGAKLELIYHEYDLELRYRKPNGNFWLGELTLDGKPIYVEHAYNGKRRMSRTWLRRKVCKFLTQLSPQWSLTR